MTKISFSNLRSKLGICAALLVAFALTTGTPRLMRATSSATLTGDFDWIHDPSRLIECEGKYYVYFTGDGITMRSSSDLINWTKGPAIFEKVPDWMQKLVPKANGKFIWAPDVIKVGDEFWLFYSYSTFGSQISAIGLVSTPTLNPQNPKYKWTDRGLVLATDGKQKSNAIDAAPIWNERGELWMSYGSWDKGGILVVRLDKTTGKPIGAPISVAAGQATGPEAPYLHFRDGFYYLFENEGLCCKGMNSTYRIMMGRSRNVAGPYLDKVGKDLAKGGGSVFLDSDGDSIGPGHVGIISQNGFDTLTYHFYNGRTNGVPTLGLQSLTWDAGGWPVAAPELRGGRYAIINQASGLALGVHNRSFDPGAPLDQWVFGGDSMQSWNVIPLGDGYYSLASLGSGKFVDVFECGTGEGAKINQQPWFNNDCQRFRIENTGDGTHRIVSKSGKNVLSLPGGRKTPRALVQNESWKNQSGQKWIFQPLP